MVFLGCDHTLELCSIAPSGKKKSEKGESVSVSVKPTLTLTLVVTLNYYRFRFRVSGVSAVLHSLSKFTVSFTCVKL